MNIYQRIVLILGALILTLNVIEIISRGAFPENELFALVGATIAVAGPTLLLFLALKGIGKK
jgi:hypothetical protein